jgi:hypothetical protein
MAHREYPVFPVNSRVTVQGMDRPAEGAVVVAHEEHDAWECPSGRKFTITWHRVTTDGGVTYTPHPDFITAE